MNHLKPTILALTLIMVVSSTTFAGNIGGLRTAGNIGGLRTAGNIGGTRSAAIPNAPIESAEPSRFDLQSAISDSFVGLIRMLLDAGALL
jgi:hypothetical protein